MRSASSTHAAAASRADASAALSSPIVVKADARFHAISLYDWGRLSLHRAAARAARSRAELRARARTDEWYDIVATVQYPGDRDLRDREAL
jgi:hypothetical protein